MAAQDLPSITCDRRAFTSQRCDVSKPDRLGYYSKKGNDCERTISVDLRTDNASYLNPTSYRMRGILTAPYQSPLSETYNLADGFDRYVPPVNVGNRLDNLYEWLVRTNRAKRPDTKYLWQLGVIAQFGRWNKYPIELACTRIGRTAFICPFENAEKKEHFDSQEQLRNTYRQVKFAQLMTKGFRAHGTMHADRTYHHVLGTRLENLDERRADRQVIKILYPAQIYALDRSDKTNSTPVEIRCERDDFEASRRWYCKALKWYLQARFSGAEKILVGMRKDNELVGITEVPVEWLRRTAEEKGYWHANISYGFLHRLLNGIRFLLRDMREGECLRVKHVPEKRVFTFEMLHTNEMFLSGPLVQKYAGHLLP
ncbi:dom-3 [Aphelenchoides avenae]|nr:dom-3 [Aphelenchus avenae]